MQKDHWGRVVPADVKKAVRDCSATDNWRNWLFLTGDWGLIVAAAATHFYVGGIPVYLLSVLVIGSRMRALANLLHESAHYKLFADRRMNAIAGMLLCAWPLYTGYRTYVRQHRLHHLNLWKGEQDPDLPLYRMTRTENARRGAVSFRSFVLTHVVFVVIPVMPLRRMIAESGRGRRLLVPLASLLAALALHTWVSGTAGDVVIRYWLIPWATAYQVIAYWAELGEHGGLSGRGHDWGSRNWRGSAASRWLIGSHSDDLYHLLHHFFPSVPHYRLTELDHTCRDRWSAYRAQDRCSGFFVGGYDGVSVLHDIWDGGGCRAETAPVPAVVPAAVPAVLGTEGNG